MLRLHLMLVAAWGGLVAAEAVLEWSCAAPPQARVAAAVHFWIDALFEIPLVAGVAATGALLAWRHGPLAPLLWVKLACSGLALAGAAICAGLVVLRYRRRDDEARLRRYRRPILLTGLAIPPALAAAVLGFLA
jgi:hypothetical protein